MANNFKTADAFVNAAVDAAGALLDGGKLLIYDGTQPANADASVGAATLLAQLAFGSPAFGAAVDGVAAANAITKDSDANATGTAAWFRATKSDDTPVFDGSVGVSGCDLNIPTTSIVQHAEVLVSSMSLTLPQA